MGLWESTRRDASGNLPYLWHAGERADQGGGPHAVRLVVWSLSKAITKSRLLAEIAVEHEKVPSRSMHLEVRTQGTNVTPPEEVLLTRLALFFGKEGLADFLL